MMFVTSKPVQFVRSKTALLLLAFVLAAGAPVGIMQYLDSREAAEAAAVAQERATLLEEAQAVVDAFRERSPGSVVLDIDKAPNTYVIQHMTDGEVSYTIKVGNSWLNLQQPSPAP